MNPLYLGRHATAIVGFALLAVILLAPVVNALAKKAECRRVRRRIVRAVRESKQYDNVRPFGRMGVKR